MSVKIKFSGDATDVKRKIDDIKNQVKGIGGKSSSGGGLLGGAEDARKNVNKLHEGIQKLKSGSILGVFGGIFAIAASIGTAIKGWSISEKLSNKMRDILKPKGEMIGTFRGYQFTDQASKLFEAAGIKGFEYKQPNTFGNRLRKRTSDLIDNVKTNPKAIGAITSSVRILGATIGVVLAAAIAGAFAIGKYISKINELRIAAINAGVSLSEMRKINAASNYSGINASSMISMIDSMKEMRIKSKLGNVESSTAFSALGINPDLFKNMSEQDRLIALASALKSIKDETVRSAVAMQLFGKDGEIVANNIESIVSGMDQVWENSTEGIENLIKRWESFKILMTNIAGTFGNMLPDMKEQNQVIIPQGNANQEAAKAIADKYAGKSGSTIVGSANSGLTDALTKIGATSNNVNGMISIDNARAQLAIEQAILNTLNSINNNTKQKTEGKY